MAALFNKLVGMTFPAPIMGKTAWVTTSQRVKLFDEVPVDQQPYMALTTHLEIDEYQHLGLTRRRLDCRAYCYSRNDIEAAIGSQTDLDVMVAAFETALAPDDPSRNNCTLGGLVYWCRIQGRVLKVPGDIDGQALMVVPILVEYP